MILYHGSSIPDIDALHPGMAQGDHPCVYLTHSKVLATIYAHNPLTRPNGFFTYWWSKDGQLFYDEYFENQLEEIYSGQTGYVYECEGNFPAMDKMPWVYLAEHPVPILARTQIPDLYTQLLQYEQDGLLTVRRWHQVSQKQKDLWKNVVRNSLMKTDRSAPLGMEYEAYIKTHFQNI